MQTTSQIAGAVAARNVGSWRLRILTRLREQPSTLWEIAAYFGAPDHTISGRFSELARDGWIEHTGERRPKPESGCAAEVWRVAGTAPKARESIEASGYPSTLKIDGAAYDQQPLLPIESYPGIPFARRTDSGALRQEVRVALVECPGCGQPLKHVIERDSMGRETKLFRCGVPSCHRTWQLKIVQEPGQVEQLALVMFAG